MYYVNLSHFKWIKTLVIYRNKGSIISCFFSQTYEEENGVTFRGIGIERVHSFVILLLPSTIILNSS